MTRTGTSLKSILLAAGLAASLAFTGCGGHHQTAGDSTTTGDRTTTGDTVTTTTDPTTTPSATDPATTTTTNSGTTSTTVLGPNGNPSAYPAAQPNPPSLAGAYPQGGAVNLITVLKTLTTYEDWVWSHPNPGLVANYELPSANTFQSEVHNITQFEQMGLHASPTPAEIDFAKVVTQPRPQVLADGKPVMTGTYQVFLGGELTVVYNLKPIPMFKANGSPSGQQFNPSSPGPTGYGISLVQGPDGQFRFANVRQLTPKGGVASLEDAQ